MKFLSPSEEIFILGCTPNNFAEMEKEEFWFCWRGDRSTQLYQTIALCRSRHFYCHPGKEVLT